MKVYVVAARCLEYYEYHPELAETKVFRDKKEAEQAYYKLIEDLGYYFTEGNMYSETETLDDNTTLVTATEYSDLCCCVTINEVEI